VVIDNGRALFVRRRDKQKLALILLLTVVVGGIAGALAFVAHHSVPEAFLAGGAAAGGALALFDRTIGER